MCMYVSCVMEKLDVMPVTALAPCAAGVDGLITEALLTGDFESAVELCLRDNRMADSIILAIAGGPGLLEKTQKKYFEKTRSKITKVSSQTLTWFRSHKHTEW